MNIKALENIRHNGVDYTPDDVLVGLSDEEGERLIKLKVGEEVDGPDLVPPSNVEDFKDLKPDVQKNLLKSLNIDPASKAEDREKQYNEWLSANV